MSTPKRRRPRHDLVDQTLAEWRQTIPDFDVAPREVYLRLYRLGMHIDRDAEQVLSQFALTRPQFRFLAALRRTGAPFQLTPRALSAALFVSSGAMTRYIDELAAAGLVERSPNPKNRRNVLIGLTPVGQARVEAALVAEADAERAFLSAITATEHATLVRTLRKLLIALEGGVSLDPTGAQPPTADSAPSSMIPR